MSGGDKVRWGIIGPGGIAKDFRDGLNEGNTGVLVAIGTRNPERSGLAEDFPGARIHNGYDALLADDNVDAVYIATPHPAHAEWAIKAAEADKHVLCEKPMGLTSFEADAMFHAARKAGTFMGEAFMYRLHPLTQKLIDLIRSGVIGEVRMIKSSFGFALPEFDPTHRLYANELAGGGILDVGGYPVSMVRLIAGAATGQGFADPDTVQGAAYLGETGVDEWASAILRFPGKIIAEVSCSVSLQQENVLRIVGTLGRLELADFWFAGGKKGGSSKIDIILNDGSRDAIEMIESRQLYSFEADAVADAIRTGAAEFSSPGMSWDDTLGNMRVLDKWRADAGLVYQIEKAENLKRTIRGDKLVHRESRIGSVNLPGISRPISRVALGFDSFRDYSGASILLDAYYEAGGNLFDTGFIYAGGKTEALLGDWLQSRGVRDEVAIIGKGAHSPLCYPDVISKQLDVTLERLKTDYVDVYFMHRDNLDVPVSEFVDAMDAEVKGGRIKGLFGGSNWTRERMDEAIAYALSHGRAVPCALSNNFSLAEMVEPVWPGVQSASDDLWKSWLKDNQMPDFAWSGQARGFFTERAGRDKLDDPELVRCWYSEKNFARRDRASELAEKLGRSTNQVALAYILAQPFPVIPLIGPRRLVELDDSLQALEIELTPEDVAWLDNGERA